MRNKRIGFLLPLCLAVLTGIVAVSCSTTRRLGPGEIRYTGVGGFDVTPIDSASKEKLPSDLMSNLKEAANCDPNDYIIAPFIKIPLGLWVYNNWNDSAGGVRGWLYNKLVKQPVLISEVRPEMRVKLMEQILDNNGYFGSSASYDIDYSKSNKKKASVDYRINLNDPYRIDSIVYLSTPEPLCNFIDSVARKSPYMQKGEIFCVDSLAAERIRIANAMRNRGYYFFRPEYIEFLADSLITPGSIALKLSLAGNMPRMARLPYRTGNIYTTVLRNSQTYPGEPDTMHTRKGDVIVMRPARLRKNLIPSCITFRKGKLFSVRDMDRTQTRLSRIGIFGNIQIQPVPVDTTPGNALLDVYTVCQFDQPIEASIEVNATSKSNSYLGPGLVLGLSHNNLFGGGERLGLQFTAAYEWQTGRNRGSVFNSYEFGLNASLAFPRMLAPSFIKRTNRDLNWTTINLGASILNRPHFFKLAEFNSGITYEWRAARHSVNQFTPFKLTYNKLISTTYEFDSIMAQNPAVALSFQSQFIPQMSYTYTLDKFLERERINGINFTFTVTEAGNLFDVIWRACGVKGEKKLFGTPFSQFVKGQAQLVYSRRLIKGADQWLVSRVLIGAEHAYGNSREVPYSEQFYIGGANSIRAFTVRSIGPGSYRAPSSLRDGYFDQTGTFKIELNSEYRFPIVSVLHGAVFVDAGNIWLLKNDPLRPGGQLRGKTFLRDIALGTGVGLRVDIGMMVLRGDLGYGLHVPYERGAYFNIPFKKAFSFHLAIGYPF
ncbi:MAG: BamA/TamA family outer membrane protein [Muribaculaceae bacterium]|nr:BamA/TamA family outer membrane protein [Muribaculaceae bacterium]MDE5712178.1 BamA/TamA family outer membrane protein [Muribaculaceae bacterium]